MPRPLLRASVLLLAPALVLGGPAVASLLAEAEGVSPFVRIWERESGRGPPWADARDRGPSDAKRDDAPGLPPGHARYIVSFDALPRGLEAGQSFRGGRVAMVDRVLHFAAVEAPGPTWYREARAERGVRVVEPDPVVHHLLAPDDPFFPQQHGPQLVRAPEAWDAGLGDPAVRVCVVDTGLRYTHEEFAGARWLGGTDLHHGDPDPWDDHGHGTHVAGIAAAAIGNARGVAGLAHAGLLAVKVLSSSGSGFTSNVAAGIRWCADHGGPRTVISMSLGSSAGSGALQDAVAYAASKGALMVAAAGNDGPCAGCVSYPARYAEVAAVACVTATRERCGFSSQGPEVELAAPGAGILSTYARDDADYATLSGTSMSTPHVAGAAALGWSALPSLTAAELRSRLGATAADLGAPGRDGDTGHGLVDARALLDGAPAPPPPPPPPGALRRVAFEDFDDGAAEGWALTGLWHVGGSCAPPPPSPPGYLAYAKASDCTFHTGSRTAGQATFPVDLAGATAAELRLQHRRATESFPGGAYDRHRIEASGDGGATWTVLRSWDSRDPAQPAWGPLTAGLDAFAGRAAQVRFAFDSVDGVANAYPGWYLDEVEVLAALPGQAANHPPRADAGADQVLADADGTGAEPATLDGRASTDPDGAIVAWAWREGGATVASGPAPTVALAVGTHAIDLTVTDDGGAEATDQVNVTVLANRPPTAQAGPDVEAADADGSGGETVRLDGSASTDPDGTIVAWAWREGGATLATGPAPEVPLAVGQHDVTLAVTDHGGATATDVVRVVVRANQPPVAAFSAAVQGLTATVDGRGASDPDGGVAAWAWSWGDGSPDGAGPTASHAYAAPGTYLVRLTVTDNGGATASAGHNVTPTAGPAVLLAEDFESGAPGWSRSGGGGDLWRIGAGCLGAASPTRSLQFNLGDGSCSYRTGARVTGGYRSPAVDLSGRAAATLRFQHAREVESFAGSYDRMQVQASRDGGATWTTIAQWDSRDPRGLAFQEVALDVSAYAGPGFRAQFLFDSVDSIANQFRGWHVDDVRLTAP